MKWFAIVLLVANLVLALVNYVRDRLPNPDAELIKQQLNAEQIRIVPARPAAPAPVAFTPPSAATGVCFQWGSFGVAELPKAQAALDALSLGERARKTEVPVSTSYWIFIPPLKSKLEMDRKANELRALGVAGFSPILESGRWRYAIALGIFRREQAAIDYLASLRRKGVRSAQMGEREQRIMQTAFLIRDPSAIETTQLGTLRSAYSGSDLSAVVCPPP
jgi:hypothetical protein